MASILDSLKKLVEWERVVNASDKVPELERRIEELERKLGELQPNTVNTCPYCGANNAWFKSSSKSADEFGFSDLGLKTITYKCKVCGQSEDKMET